MERNEGKHELLKVRIIRPPDLQIQDGLSKELVGMEFIGKRIPDSMPELSLVLLTEKRNRGGIIISRLSFIDVLKTKNPRFGLWLDRNIAAELLYVPFGPDEYEVVKRYSDWL